MFISEMIASDIHPIDVAAVAGNSPHANYKYYYENIYQKDVDAKMQKALWCLCNHKSDFIHTILSLVWMKSLLFM